MSNLSRKLKDPSDVIVEKTAGEMAGVFYDAARSSGMTVIQLQGKKINLLNYKSPSVFATKLQTPPSEPRIMVEATLPQRALTIGAMTRSE